MSDAMEKRFYAPTKEAVWRAADQWWAEQTGFRKLHRTEVAIGDDGPSLRNANRWAVTIHYEKSN